MLAIGARLGKRRRPSLQLREEGEQQGPTVAQSPRQSPGPQHLQSWELPPPGLTHRPQWGGIPLSLWSMADQGAERPTQGHARICRIA